MVRGIYTAAAGMMTIQEQTDTTANNLANVDTTGFKADLLLFTSAPAIHTWRVDDPSVVDEQGETEPEYLGLTNCGTMDTEIWRDFEQGQLVFTGIPLDVAIVGDGFFRVMEDGTEYYSRDGQFRQTADGYLTDNQGRRIQGLGGDINLGGATEVYVNRSGGVYADGALVDTLDLAFLSDPQQQLSKVGDNLWTSATAPDGAGVTDVRGGYLERSNVDVVRCITELITELRHYEAAQRVIITEDTTLELAANQLGRMPQ